MKTVITALLSCFLLCQNVISTPFQTGFEKEMVLEVFAFENKDGTDCNRLSQINSNNFKKIKPVLIQSAEVFLNQDTLDFTLKNFPSDKKLIIFVHIVEPISYTVHSYACAENIFTNKGKILDIHLYLNSKNNIL